MTSRGGKRRGAGRPGQKAKTTDLRSIDVRRMAREDCLREGRVYSWAWKDGAGNVISSVDLSVSRDGVTIAYSRAGKEVAEFARVEHTPCNYGGSRPWFLCPHCRQRVAQLYIGGDVACRTCFGMAYPSQSEGATDRLRRRKAKIEDRLNDGKRKTDATIEQLRRELIGIEHRLNRALDVFLSRYFGADELV